MEVIIRDEARRRQFWWPREFEQTMKLPVLKSGRRRRLFCRNGVYLRVSDDKRVSGTTNPFDAAVVFDIIPAGLNCVRIRNVKRGLYVAIDQNGDIMTKSSPDEECVFEETNNSNFYDIYKRPRNGVGPPFVLGLRKNGEAESTLYRGKKQAKFSEFCFITQLIYSRAYSAEKVKKMKAITEIPSSDQTDSRHIYSTTRKRVVTTVTRQEPVQTRKLRAAHYYTKKQ